MLVVKPLKFLALVHYFIELFIVRQLQIPPLLTWNITVLFSSIGIILFLKFIILGLYF